MGLCAVGVSHIVQGVLIPHKHFHPTAVQAPKLRNGGHNGGHTTLSKWVVEGGLGGRRARHACCCMHGARAPPERGPGSVHRAWIATVWARLVHIPQYKTLVSIQTMQGTFHLLAAPRLLGGQPECNTTLISFHASHASCWGPSIQQDGYTGEGGSRAPPLGRGGATRTHVCNTLCWGGWGRGVPAAACF